MLFGTLMSWHSNHHRSASLLCWSRGSLRDPPGTSSSLSSSSGPLMTDEGRITVGVAQTREELVYVHDSLH